MAGSEVINCFSWCISLERPESSRDFLSSHETWDLEKKSQHPVVKSLVRLPRREIYPKSRLEKFLPSPIPSSFHCFISCGIKWRNQPLIDYKTLIVAFYTSFHWICVTVSLFILICTSWDSGVGQDIYNSTVVSGNVRNVRLYVHTTQRAKTLYLMLLFSDNSRNHCVMRTALADP